MSSTPLVVHPLPTPASRPLYSANPCTPPSIHSQSTSVANTVHFMWQSNRCSAPATGPLSACRYPVLSSSHVVTVVTTATKTSHPPRRPVGVPLSFDSVLGLLQSPEHADSPRMSPKTLLRQHVPHYLFSSLCAAMIPEETVIGCQSRAILRATETKSVSASKIQGVGGL
jgi:hypothetical protein